MTRAERKRFEELLQKVFGCKEEVFRGQPLLISGRKGRIWLTTKRAVSFDLQPYRIHTIGLYIGRIDEEGRPRLSVEGAEIVARYATRNIVYVDEQAALAYAQGKDVSPARMVDCDNRQYVIIMCGNRVIGCGLLVNRVVKNILPKGRLLYPST